MKENWLEIKIEFNFKDRFNMIRDFVKPIVLSLDKENLAETFHFLFYKHPESYMRLRIRTQDKETISRVKSVIEENLKHIEKLKIKTEFDEYNGEQENYGEKGWEIAQKFFEYGSRISLIKHDPKITKGKYFNEGKFVHCFLNTLGYTYQDEVCFHYENSKFYEKYIQSMKEKSSISK